jgi:hypothetical protein
VIEFAGFCGRLVLPSKVRQYAYAGVVAPARARAIMDTKKQTQEIIFYNSVIFA